MLSNVPFFIDDCYDVGSNLSGIQWSFMEQSFEFSTLYVLQVESHMLEGNNCSEGTRWFAAGFVVVYRKKLGHVRLHLQYRIEGLCCPKAQWQSA